MPVFAENRKAKFDYEILESLSAGIELFGSEVKSVRMGKISLVGSFVVIRGMEAFLQGAKIEPYQPNNETTDYDPERPKKLLLKKEELEKLTKAEAAKGLTIVPIKVYNAGRFLKLEVAIVRGKKRFDKRETIKKRDIERDLKKDF